MSGYQVHFLSKLRRVHPRDVSMLNSVRRAPSDSVDHLSWCEFAQPSGVIQKELPLLELGQFPFYGELSPLQDQGWVKFETIYSWVLLWLRIGHKPHSLP